MENSSEEAMATLALRIQEKARELGFHSCGFVTARPLMEEEAHLETWLSGGMHAGMHYMEKNREKRLDPSQLLEGTRTVICLLHNYAPDHALEGPYRIARYAYGHDYHRVLKQKMRPLLHLLQEMGSKIHRGFTDSAPILERIWAREAGLGWIGKNSLLITPTQGSYFFLAEIFTDLDLPASEARMRDYCGGCIRCMTACPTAAIVAPGIVDARRCISYLTIENKDEIPDSFQGKYSQWVFGCDICQEVCPWNAKAKPHNEPAFGPKPGLFELSESQWEKLDADSYQRVFTGTPVERAGYIGLKRNIQFLG